MNYDKTLENLVAVRKVVTDFIVANHVIFNMKHKEAIDDAISAIKTLQDMDKTLQKLIELTPSEIELLAAFLRNHSASEVIAITSYVSHETLNKKENTK